ncbi:uncharacterized protein LOC127797312 isoform X2 [Diospyros lotus]|nr:uncharacterized protein LOC127797312 isoform X2 [Diospyros lotus]
MVMADNKVWDDFIKVHPDARSYRIRTIPYYSDLCVIYKNATFDRKPSLSGEDANADRNMLGSETCTLVQGVESPDTTIDDGEPVDSSFELSSHSGGNTNTTVTPPRSVVEGAVEALHEITIDEEYGNSKPKISDDGTHRPIAGTESRGGTRSRTFWQPPMDRYLIDLMLEQLRKGNQVDGQFHKQSWMEMIASFNSRFGFKYDIDVLKNRYKTMKRQYKVIKNLLRLDGFSWDETRQMVTADDYVWQDYIKAHTDARQYMTRPVPYYKDLCVICRELSGDGRESLSSYDLYQQDEALALTFGGSLKGVQSPAASVYSEDQVGDMLDSSLMGNMSVCNQQKKQKHCLENVPYSTHTNKKARGSDEGMAGALREMATAVSSLADKKKEDEDWSSVSIEHVIEAIQALPDMDEDLVLDACDFLEDEKKAKTFLALDVKLRKKWLIRKLRPQQS